MKVYAVFDVLKPGIIISRTDLDEAEKETNQWSLVREIEYKPGNMVRDLLDRVRSGNVLHIFD